MMGLSTELPTLRDLPDSWAFELHPSGDYVSDVIRQTGDWFERPILDEITRRLIALRMADRPAGVIIDAGAHIGNHTAYFAAFVPHTAIHAFEPLPANLELLRRNVAPYPTVTVHPVALSDRGRTVRLLLESGNLGHSRIMEDDGAPVRAMPLDAYQLFDVSLLKIDVEGHEAKVLAGARETIERCHPLLVIEDWSGKGYDLPGYELVCEWETAHQTFMYAWTGDEETP